MCHHRGLRVVEPVYHQGSLRGRLRSWRRASRQGQPCSCLFFKTHLIGLLLSFCAEPQTSREVDQDREGGLTRQRNVRPSFLIMCCVWEIPSQVDVTFHNDYDEPELPEHEVLVTEDAHEEGKPCLICSRHDLFNTRSVQDTICSTHDLFNTRSVQDTICSRHELSRHISRCLFLSHTPCQLLR